MSLASGDLTTYANAQVYVVPLSGQAPTAALVTGLVTRISRIILTYLNRAVIVPQSHTQQFNGTGTTSLVLPSWPVLGSSLTLLQINGQAINLAPQANDPASFNVPYGYRFQPWSGAPPGDAAVVELVGGAYFPIGNQNVVATYESGYGVTGEKVPTTAGTSYVPLAPYGIWATDNGVEYTASGAPLTPTTGAPGVGQYVPPSPDATSPVNIYTFNASDVTAGLSVSYGYIPADLEQACLEFIGERASYRNRIGVRSQNLAGQESLSFELGLPAYIAAMLQPYVSVLPPAIGANV